MDCRRLPLVLFAAVSVSGLTGCGSTMPRDGGLVPNRTLQLSPSFGVPLEKVVYWGAYVGVAYLILDPLAPNWEIEQAPLADNHIHLSLKMKRYYAGGAGEARQVFQRRARDLVQYGGFDGYEIREYSEGLESSVLGSQRVSMGVIRLTGKGHPPPGDQGDSEAEGGAPPARMTPAKATNPLS